MADLGPTIETERLILRPPAAGDFDASAEFYADAEAVRYIGGAKARSETWRNFVGWVGAWVVQGFGMFSVIDKQTGRWLGRIGPHFPEGWPGPEVGWAIVRDAWGQGIAYEAARASMDYAVDQLGWEEIIHCIDDGNTASQRLAQRLGSRVTRRGMMPAPIDREIDLWTQTAAQWREARAKG